MIATLAKTRTSPLRDPDVRLMLRVKRDDPAAFRLLLDRHSQKVHKQLTIMVGSATDAEDLTQEVFLRVFRHRKSYTAKAKFITWLYHIVRNVGRNALRDRRRHPTVPLHPTRHDAGYDGLAGTLADHRAEAPTSPLERHELKRVLRDALDTLGPRQRAALEEQQFFDRSYAELADQFALSTQAAKSLLYRARLQLRDALEEYMVAE